MHVFQMDGKPSEEQMSHITLKTNVCISIEYIFDFKMCPNILAHPILWQLKLSCQVAINHMRGPMSRRDNRSTNVIQYALLCA
jgi:hypothetical protein